MKKIINGRRYSTETAELIAEWRNGYYSNDFHYCEEALYQTKKGSFFITGEGGALSKYSRSCGSNARCGGSDIIPLSDDDARLWLEERDFTAEVERYFAADIEDA